MSHTSFPARRNHKRIPCFVMLVVQPDGIIGIAPGDFLPVPLTVSKDIPERCLIKLMLMHLMDGMTG
jgi:hypothetical protein